MFRPANADVYGKDVVLVGLPTTQVGAAVGKRREYHATKDAEHHSRRATRYDMAIRTLTLALVLISVTLLVTRKYLFWFGVFVASIGALLGVTGYFLR